MNPTPCHDWSIDHARDLYRVAEWGLGFFGINPAGHVTVHPRREQGPGLDLAAVVETLATRGVTPPLLLRFPDILHTRLAFMADCFHQAIQQSGFQGAYRPVYPVKVNQQQQLVTEMVACGQPYGLGLEVGSKPELAIALAHQRNGLIICNGSKDDSFIRMALLGGKSGRQVVLVMEKPRELARILAVAAAMGVRPVLGVRFKPDVTGSGIWERSAGSFSKFGLTAAETLAAVQVLQSHGLLDCLQLLHFHLGSQITSIQTIKRGLQEAARYFVQLRQLGCPVHHVDVGGGLGVDYDGSRSVHDASVDYSLREYVADVVSCFLTACQENNLSHPDILTESGRALTAHHALLVVNALEVTRSGHDPLPAAGGDGELAGKFRQLLDGMNGDNGSKTWHTAIQLREDGRNMFRLGYLDLAQRARCEQLFDQIARQLSGHAASQESRAAAAHAREHYHCNFSVFQSLPDSWAVGQLFPVMPIHRLTEIPGHHGVLQDLTCDSDGIVDRFIDQGEPRDSLPLHALRPGEPYWLGVFLVGAYQDILGEPHNLFGATHVAQVTWDDHGQLQVNHSRTGHNIGGMLAEVGYESRAMEDALAEILHENSTTEDADTFMRAWRAFLKEYTYIGDG